MTYENKDFFKEMADNQEYYIIKKKGNDLYVDIHGIDYFPIWTNTHSLNKYLNNSYINKDDLTIFKCSLDSIKEILNNIDENFVLINHSYMSADYKSYGDVVNIKQMLNDLYKTGNCVSPLILNYQIIDNTEFEYDNKDKIKINKETDDDCKDYTIEYTNSFNATHINNNDNTIKSSLLLDVLKFILLFAYNSIVIYFVVSVITASITGPVFLSFTIIQILLAIVAGFLYSMVELIINNSDDYESLYILVKVAGTLRVLVMLGGIVPILITQLYNIGLISEFFKYLFIFISIIFSIRYAYLYAYSSPCENHGKTLFNYCMRTLAIAILSNIGTSRIVRPSQNKNLLNELNSIIVTPSEEIDDKYTITKLHQYFNADKSDMHKLVFNLKYKDYQFYNEMIKNNKLSKTDKIVIEENANIIKDWDNNTLNKCLKMIADKEQYKDLQKQKQSYETSRNKFDVDTSSRRVIENIEKMSTDIKEDFDNK